MFPVAVPVDFSESQLSQSALEDLPLLDKYVSISHALHCVSPLPSWYWPGRQKVHSPSLFPYLPKSHFSHVAAPTFVVVSPNLHIRHVVASLSLPCLA